MRAAVGNVADFKAKMIVLRPSCNVWAAVEMNRGRLFPATIVHAEIDMRFLESIIGLARVPCLHVAR